MIILRNAILNNDKVDILVEGEKIFKIDSSIENFYSCEEYDLKGSRILPALIDGHVHVTGGGGEGGFTTMVPPIKYESVIKAGVTTLVGLLGTDSVTRSVENLIAKVRELGEYNIRTYALTGSYAYPTNTITGSVKRDIVFINEIIGCKIAISDHRSSFLDKHELVRLASECFLGGLISGKVGELHMHTGSLGKSKLKPIFEILDEFEIPITTFRPTHCGNLVDDAIKFMNMGGYADFTVGEETPEVLDYVLKKAPFDRVTLSSDSNGSMPIWNDKKEMVGIGAGKISELFNNVKSLANNYNRDLFEVHKLVSTNVARALNINNVTGEIKEGLSCDLIVLDKDLNITDVFSKGVCELRNGLVTRKTNFSDLR